MKRLRKIFASLVMVTTVLTTVGAFAPSVNAAAQAGDLIKKDGLSAVYYLGEDGKRYVFPNEATYKSWYSDFSGVVTVSADELASYPLGANVVIRPGTKLVKITTDPKVYAVEPNGSLRWVQTEADAIALYGANWAQRVVDVADSFFTNYTIGQPLASNEVPVGSLVKKSGENSIYYYDGTNYRLIEDEVAFLANRFQNANVLTLNSFTAGGTTITGAESAIVKTSQSGQSTGWKPGQGTGVTVALNSMTPASQSVPATVSRVPFTKVNFTASNDGATILEAITVKRSGLTENYTQFDRIWAEKDGVMVSSKRALNSNDEAILTFAPALNIPAGQTVTIDIIASLVSASGNGALGIASASAVTASGATVSGSFPIVGNVMSFTSYDVAQLTVASTAAAGFPYEYTVKVGDEDVELAKFDINFGTNPRDVIVNSIMLRNTGTEDLATVVMDLYLENNGNVVSEKGVINGRYVTFNMKNGGLTMLKDDSNQVFYVKGDVIGKDNATDPGLKLLLNKKEDLYAYEKATGFGVSLGHADNLLVSEIAIEAGAVSVSKKSTSPADTTVVKNSKSVNALVANLKADEAINADGLTVKVANASVGVSSFENIKVYLNGILLGSFDVPTTSTNISTFSISEEVDSTLSLKKGDNEVKVTVDVKSAATAGDKIAVKLDGTSLLTTPEYAANQNAVDSADISGTASGAIITVEGGDLSVTRNDGYVDGRKAVKGTTDVSLAKFAVKALNDTVKLTSVSLAANSATGTKVPDSSVYDMKLFVDGAQIGSTKDFSSGATFSSLSLSIAKNATKVIELKGSFDSSATGTLKTVATFNSQDSLGKSITPAPTAASAQFEITEGGTLTVAKGANTPYSNILVAKTGVEPGVEQAVADFRLTAVDDSANITELVIENATTTADARISSYKLYDGTLELDTAIPTNGEATFYISGNKLVVPANGSKTISVKAVFNAIDVVADTNAQLTLGIKDGSIIAKSSNGSELAQANISGEATAVANHMFVRKTKPTFSKENGIVGGASSAQEIARFAVAADANEDLRLTAIAFTRNGTGSATPNGYVLYEVGNSTALATSATADFSGFETVINKGTDKTYRVTANTSSVASDATFGVSLSNVAATNKIAWGEYFVTGYEDYDSTYVEELPLDFSSMKY